MIGMVLVTHGRLADELRSAMEHVVGTQRNVDTVCIGPEDDMEGRRAEIEGCIDRCDTGQQFCSYARLCGAVQSSDNKRCGSGNKKAGNAWLKWAFSEAAVLSAQKEERIDALLHRLAAKLGKAKAYSALAHKLGRAFYHMLRTKEVFDVNRFVRH